MSNSKDYQLREIRPLILAMMQDEGRNFEVCEYKGCTINRGEYELHHTKYEGATYQDLMIVCKSCNRIGENMGIE